MPRLTAGRGRGRERRKKQGQERRREGRGGDPKDEPDNVPRRIQRECRTGPPRTDPK